MRRNNAGCISRDLRAESHGILLSDHGNCDRLWNDFASHAAELHDAKTQELIVTIHANGRKSAELCSASNFGIFLDPYLTQIYNSTLRGKGSGAVDQTEANPDVRNFDGEAVKSK